VENPNFAEVGVRSIGSPHVLLDLTRFFTSNFGVRAKGAVRKVLKKATPGMAGVFSGTTGE
jgi:hypothetical protein